MNKKIYFIFGIMFILASILTLTIITKAQTSVTYSYDIISKSNDDNLTIVKSNDFNTEWVIESKEWFDNCKIKGSNILNLDCKETTYEQFIESRVKNIANETLRLQLASLANEVDVVILQQRVEVLEAENKMLKDCITNSKDFEELKVCLK